MEFFDNGKNLFRILSVLELSWDGALRHANPRPFHALSFRLKGDASFVHDGISSHVADDSIAHSAEIDRMLHQIQPAVEDIPEDDSTEKE